VQSPVISFVRVSSPMYWPSNLAEPCAHATPPSPVPSRRPNPRSISAFRSSRSGSACRLQRAKHRSLVQMLEVWTAKNVMSQCYIPRGTYASRSRRRSGCPVSKSAGRGRPLNRNSRSGRSWRRVNDRFSRGPSARWGEADAPAQLQDFRA
jgi:hypothetical protein